MLSRILLLSFSFKAIKVTTVAEKKVSKYEETNRNGYKIIQVTNNKIKILCIFLGKTIRL